jgi:large subunit ribosomal protein L29
MAALQMNEVVGKDKASLLANVSELKRELLNLRFQKASGELGNTARFREVRVGIARAYTELSKLKHNQTRG